MTHMTRREILRLFLGAPALAALGGCGTSKPDRDLPPGTLVGASHDFGHRLRTEAPPEPPQDAWQSAGVVIVGGGVAGLSAAWRLLRAGYRDFVLLELESDVGGTARGGRNAVAAYPWGAHYICAPSARNRPLTELLGEMGILDGTDERGEPVVGEQFLVRDPDERLFHLGRWEEGLYQRAGASDEDLRQLAAFNALAGKYAEMRDGQGRRAFDIPLGLGSDDANLTELDRMSMAEFLERNGFTSERLCRFVRYACRDDYGVELEQTSAWAGVFYYASRIERAGSESRPLVTWPQGNGRIVEYLTSVAGEKISTGLAVADVNPVERNGKGEVEVRAFDRANDRGAAYRAQCVIFAAPQFLARYVIRPWRADPPTHLGAFEYGAWMVANLTLKDRPAESGYPLCWDNVIYDSPSLGYVVATHQAGRERGPTVFTYYYPLCDGDPKEARARLLATDRDAWAETALADLARPHPEIRTLCERLDVMRWGHAMVRPKPGFLWGQARRQAAAPFRGIHFAHSDLSGVALFEEAQFQGARAADEVLKVLGMG